MPANQSSALRIFLSSTALDMLEYRKNVSDAILKLNHLPVGMENFGANPKPPVNVCKEKLLECNALVAMIAHRYGWVPSQEEGGDGKESITWIEIKTALENDVPVFAFVVDETFGWALPKEQDLLVNTTDSKKVEDIIKNVRSLSEFKEFLNSKAGLVRDKFTKPEDLALKVTTSLAGWIAKQTVISGKQPQPQKLHFTFRTVHHLQPAPYFKGREKLITELKDWWQTPVTPDRVISLIAIGGTGKTAIVQRFLSSISQEKLRGSVLVWSFYDEPNTDAFLNEACIVFTGEEPEGAGGKLEKLQRALTAENHQHLIVLDGLERVQSEGKGYTNYAKGDLEDHRLKNLLRAIAGGLGNTRMLITSRFKLTDLVQWENAGYKGYELDVLDKESAKQVLKAWNIKGSDEKLIQIAESVGCHALSVSVLGSYLNHYCNCDSDGIDEFKLAEFSSDESQAAKLKRVLDGYAKSLPNEQRDLLIRLSVFPKGVTIEILVYLITAGGEISGALIGASQSKLIIIAEKLKQQGLIYSYQGDKTIVYTSHPFLRDYFRNLLGVKPEDIHEVVRAKLAIGLDTKPKSKPRDITVLDKYEKLIEYSILANHYDEAYDLYENSMGGGGGDDHLYHKMGDYGRIIRTISLFTEDGTPQTITKQINGYRIGNLINLWGLAASALGDLKTSSNCLSLANEVYLKLKSWKNVSATYNNKAWVNIVQARYISAQKFLKESSKYLDLSGEKDDLKYHKKIITSYLAHIYHSTGEIGLASEHFAKATEIEGSPLTNLNGFYETTHLLEIGNKEKAVIKANENLAICEKGFGPQFINLCKYMVGMLSLPDSATLARKYLQDIREWTEISGHMETIIRSHILASEIAYYSADYGAALSEAMIGINHAEGSDYGKFTIDLSLQLSKIHLAIPDYKTALSFARKAFDKSSHADCSYAWGEANGLHLCGICHKALGEYELARQRLTAALKIRKKIQHPEVEETRKLLAELPLK